MAAKYVIRVKLKESQKSIKIERILKIEFETIINIDISSHFDDHRIFSLQKRRIEIKSHLMVNLLQSKWFQEKTLFK